MMFIFSSTASAIRSSEDENRATHLDAGKPGYAMNTKRSKAKPLR